MQTLNNPIVGLPERSQYRPQALDTSGVNLDDGRNVVESLARNAHEVWAQMRTQNGWTYGPERNDALKLHPCLVPFEELPESDRAFDRAMVAELLKAAILMGFCK
jgi:ryanodine receptor 2